MDIRNRKALRREADAAVAANTGDPRLTLLVYVAVSLVGSLAIAILRTVLGNRIATTGGLQNLGLQATLSTIQTAAPLIWAIAMMGLDLGRQSVCLNMVRRRSVEPRSLLAGFPKLGGLIRAGFLQGALYLLILILAVNIGSIIFMATPLAQDLYAIVAEIALDSEALYEALYNDPEFLNQVFSAMLPVYPIVAVLFLIVAIPVFYRYRMTNYCLLDQPRNSALVAMGESISMTKGNRWALVKLDLSFWWFYALEILISLIAYGDMLLPLVGISFPWPDTISFYLFYVLSLGLQVAVYHYFLNRINVTYAIAYEILKPETPEPTKVALGNIFDLAKDYQE